MIHPQVQNTREFNRRHQQAFSEWVNNLFSLAIGPTPDVWSYSGHIIDGVRFHMVERDSRHTTQNSGVMVVTGENNNF